MIDLTYASVKIGCFYKNDLVLKKLMRIEIAEGRNVLAKKSYVKILIIVYKHCYFISLKQS